MEPFSQKPRERVIRKKISRIFDYDVDTSVISPEEALEYILWPRHGDRPNHRRIQAWFHHCARIRRSRQERALQRLRLLSIQGSVDQGRN